MGDPLKWTFLLLVVGSAAVTALPNPIITDSQNDAVVVPDPIALYPLNSQHGTRELANRQPQGTSVGVSLATGPNGNAGGSYQFIGQANSYIEFPNNGGLDAQRSMTMLCWLYPQNTDGPIFNYKTSGSWGVHMWVVSGKLFARFTKRNYQFTDGLITSQSLALEQWQYVGASYDHKTGIAKLWLDGKQVMQKNIGAGITLGTQDNVRMGVKGGDGRYFRGRITAMQIYDVALTEEQVNAVKNAGRVVMVPDPIAFYPLNRQYETRELENGQPQGTPVGVSLATGPNGNTGGSYQFIGKPNSYIEFPNNGGLDTQRSITMLCWLYPQNTDGPIFNYKTSGSWGVHMWVVSGKLFARFTKRNYQFTDGLITSQSLALEQWQYVGASYDHKTGIAKLWLDGKQVMQKNIGAGMTLGTQDNARMGAKGGDGRYFRGRITAMQIYDVALSEQQVNAVKIASRAVAFYPLNRKYGAREIENRQPQGTSVGVSLAPGPNGKTAGSYQFTGQANSYIEFPNNGGLDAQRSITMLCWLYPQNTDGPIFNYKTSGSWGVHMWVVSGKLFVRFTKRNYQFTDGLVTSQPLALEQWQYVGASYDHKTGIAKLWLGGQQVVQTNIGAGITLGTQDNVRMGAKGGDGRYFRGRITAMQIYDVALTEEEINVVKTAGQRSCP